MDPLISRCYDILFVTPQSCTSQLHTLTGWQVFPVCFSLLVSLSTKDHPLGDKFRNGLDSSSTRPIGWPKVVVAAMLFGCRSFLEVLKNMGPLGNVGCLKQEFSVKFCEFYKMGVHVDWVYPRGSMYGIFTYIYHKSQLNVGKYTIHGWYGYVKYSI